MFLFFVLWNQQHTQLAVPIAHHFIAAYDLEIIEVSPIRCCGYVSRLAIPCGGRDNKEWFFIIVKVHFSSSMCALYSLPAHAAVTFRPAAGTPSACKPPTTESPRPSRGIFLLTQ